MAVGTCRRWKVEYDGIQAGCRAGLCNYYFVGLAICWFGGLFLE